MTLVNDDTIYINHSGLSRTTNKAKLFIICDKKFWIPNSVIINNDKKVVIIQKWWAKKNGLRSDW